jgi:hypothetical protein
MNALDEPLNLRKSDLAVVTGIVHDLEDTQTRLTRLLSIHEKRIADLRAVIEEWRKPIV